MPPENASAELLGALSKLLTATAAASLRLDTPDADEARATQVGLVDQLSDYILPRLVQMDAPVIVVVGGSTGAGKSTLVNSLVGERVSESGVLRPTTRSPVLVHHPADREWFQPERLLPTLPRTVEMTNEVNALRIAEAAGVPRGMAILDAPDIDSIHEGNRKLAAQLLAAADLWLFVTSAARYADQVPWDYLRQASERSTSLAVVLDRTAPDAVAEVRPHLARMMTSRGLSDSPLFTVQESSIDHEGLLERDAVAPISRWLRDLAADPATRWAVMKRTLDGAVRHSVFRAHDVADALEEQAEAAGDLTSAVDSAYARARQNAAAAIANGTLVSGELLTGWTEFDQSGDLLEVFERKGLRRRLAPGRGGRNQRGTALLSTAGQAVLSLAIVQAESAAESVMQQWREFEAGKTLLAPVRGLDRPSQDVRARLERVVSEWESSLSAAVEAEVPASRRFSAIADEQVSALAAILGVVTLDQEGPDGVSAPGRRLLEKAASPAFVSRVVNESRGHLLSAIGEIVDGERQRFFELLDSPETVLASRDALREAARAADDARHNVAMEETSR